MTVPSILYNGTAPNGDSGSSHSLASNCIRTIIQGAANRRRNVGLNGECVGLVDAPGSGLFLFRSNRSEIRPINDHVVIHCNVSWRYSSTASVFVIFVNHEWFIWGYSLTFSKTANKFIGNLDNIGFRGMLKQDSDDFPDLLFALFQGMFASFTPALLIGAAGERGRMLPCMIFVFTWTTLVYDPIAFWTWNSTGWAYQLGVLDFAGGTPVHISSGAAALAYSFFLGKRKKEPEV